MGVLMLCLAWSLVFSASEVLEAGWPGRAVHLRNGLTGPAESYQKASAQMAWIILT